MESLRLLIALALPALLGRLWLGLLIPPATPARRMLIWGQGLLVGLLALPLLMRALDMLGIPLGFFSIASLTVLLAMPPTLALVFRKSSHRVDCPSIPDPERVQGWHHILVVFFLVLIVLRITTVGLELVWRPLFPWDATMHWATKARVWYDAAEILPFVEGEQWLELGGRGVFTDHHPGYPITTPLLQVWMSFAAGRWDESLINLPWLACLIALGLAFYGQARLSGASVLAATVFTYLLLSMPLLNIHVALAGYADLFLGACYCAALMAFYNWSVSRQPWQAALVLLFALCCPLIKNEGFYWLLTFLPGLVALLLPASASLLSLALLVILAALVMLFLPGDMVIAGHTLDGLKMYYRPEALGAIVTSVWIHDNWHLFGYLLASLPVLGLVILRSRARDCLGIATALASAVGLFLVLFLYTKYSFGAARFSSVGRISLQLVPGLLFLAMVLVTGFSTSGPTLTAESEPD